MQSFKFNFQLSNWQLFNQQCFTDFLIKETNQKARKAIDNINIILHKIHLSLFAACLRHLLPPFTPGIWPIWGLVIVKNKLTSQLSFLCSCPVIYDKLCHYNIVKVAVEPQSCRQVIGQMHRKLMAVLLNRRPDQKNLVHDKLKICFLYDHRNPLGNSWFTYT